MTHGALQEADGTWTSKLGIGTLIRHQTPQALNGATYGVPVAVYARRTNYGWTNASMASGSTSGIDAAPTTRSMTVTETSLAVPGANVRQKQLGVAPVAGNSIHLTIVEKQAARSEQRQLRTQLADIRKGKSATPAVKSQALDLTELSASLDELALDVVMSDLKDTMLVI